MRLENIAIDSPDPAVLGGFWADALGLEVITRKPDLLEARLSVGECWLDLCFPRVPDASPERTPRLHLDLDPGADQQETVERLLGLGARHLDLGQGDVPWTVLADPAGNAFCVLDPRPQMVSTGPVMALPLDSADPARDLAFWKLASGWVPVPGTMEHSLQHPGGDGPVLELCPEVGPASGHGRMHLDVRPEEGEDGQDCLTRLLDAGATRARHDWGSLPWTVLLDPSGNEVCLLGVPS